VPPVDRALGVNVPKETYLVVAVVIALVVGFLRFTPRGTDPVRLRSFNRQALVVLAMICVAVVGLLFWRATRAGMK